MQFLMLVNMLFGIPSMDDEADAGRQVRRCGLADDVEQADRLGGSCGVLSRVGSRLGVAPPAR